MREGKRSEMNRLTNRYGKGKKQVYWNRFSVKKGGYALWEGDIVNRKWIKLEKARLTVNVSINLTDMVKGEQAH